MKKTRQQIFDERVEARRAPVHAEADGVPAETGDALPAGAEVAESADVVIDGDQIAAESGGDGAPEGVAAAPEDAEVVAAAADVAQDVAPPAEVAQADPLTEDERAELQRLRSLEGRVKSGQVKLADESEGVAAVADEEDGGIAETGGATDATPELNLDDDFYPGLSAAIGKLAHEAAVAEAARVLERLDAEVARVSKFADSVREALNGFGRYLVQTDYDAVREAHPDMEDMMEEGKWKAEIRQELDDWLAELSEDERARADAAINKGTWPAMTGALGRFKDWRGKRSAQGGGAPVRDEALDAVAGANSSAAVRTSPSGKRSREEIFAQVLAERRGKAV